MSASNQDLTKPITIAVDAMGGDFGVSSSIAGSHMALKELGAVSFVFFGDEGKIKARLKKFPELESVSSIHHTALKIASDEKPSTALRNSKGTSMRLAIEAVKNGEADAIVSSGNTGALMALSKLIFKTIEGIHRPAIASVFPTVKKHPIVMLDLGGNVLVESENLVQFAFMGTIFAKAHRPELKKPSVGLLNVGSEDMKGPDHVRGAAAILSEINFPGQYQGFVEGNDITAGTVDVVVADGYAGNIALKTAEGVSKFASFHFKQAMKSDPLAILGSLLALPALARAKKKIDPRRSNGGVFLGLNGICVKSHGGADALAFSAALALAAEQARAGFVQQVTDEMAALVSNETFLT